MNFKEISSLLLENISEGIVVDTDKHVLIVECEKWLDTANFIKENKDIQVIVAGWLAGRPRPGFCENYHESSPDWAASARISSELP